MTVGTPGPDVIVALFGGVMAKGGADLICSREGLAGAVHAGPGNDRVQVFRGGTAFGDAGDDVLTVHGTRSRGAGLVGGPGDDVLRAPGTHHAYFTPGPGDDLVHGTAHDNDVVIFRGANTGVRVDLRKGIAHGQGRDRLISIEQIQGSRHADVLYGGHGRNKFAGGGGNDIIVLGGGDDQSDGEAGDDYIVGGDGDDALSGGKGSDALYGRTGADLLFEKDRPEANLIDGGAGSDRCFGGYTVPPNAEISCERH